MGEAVDEVEDSTEERKRDPRVRAAGTCVAEDCSPVVIDGDVLPLKGGEERPAGGRLRVLRLQAGEMSVVEAETNRRYGVSREGVPTGFLLPGACCRVQLYSEMADRCRCCLAEQRSVFFVKAWTSGRWSVWMVNNAPSRRCLK